MTSTAPARAPRTWWRARATALAVSGVLAFTALAAAPATGAVVERPTLTSITPAIGPAAGGQQFTATGTHLLNAKFLFEFENYATNVVCTATSCTGITPAGTYAGQAQQVFAITDGGNSLEENVTSTSTYTYYRVPQVSGISPASGTAAGGTQVTITGRDLIGANAITFGPGPGRKATNVNCPEYNTCTATTPPGTSGAAVDVQVTSPGGTSPANTAARFTYTSPLPTITSISPSIGPLGGGNWISITGTNLTGLDAVLFGANYASSGGCTTSTSCSALVPAGTAAGTVDVRTHTPQGWSPITPAARYTYGLPIVTGLSPNHGPAAGGNRVTINGVNLNGATAVTFGPGRKATNVNCTITSCTVTAPPGPVSRVNVQVTTPHGTSPANDGNLYSYKQ